MFENQRSFSPEAFRQFAQQLGLDEKAFGECLDSEKFRDAITQDYQAAERLGVNATPTFFINGRYLSGAQPFEAFQSIIDEEIERNK